MMPGTVPDGGTQIGAPTLRGNTALVFLEQYPRFIGGSERMSLALCRHAIGKGLTCALAYSDWGDMVEAYADIGASIHQLPVSPLAVRRPHDALRSIRTLVRLVRQVGADWIFTSQISYVSLLAVVGKLTRARSVVHLGLAYDFPSPLFGFAMRHVTLGIAPSDHAARYWLKRGWPEKRLRVIPNGIDTGIFSFQKSRDQARKESNIVANNGPLVAYVGRLVEAKGIFTLLRAFASWRKKTNTGHLLFVGQAAGDENRALQNLAAETGLPAAAWEVRPPTAHPELFYRAADLVVVPSEWDEPFGLVPLEAMACGTLTVVSDRGVMPGFVAPLGDACVFHAGDVSSLETRLQRWLGDASAREAAAAQLSQFVSQNFSFSACGDAYLDALGIRPSPPATLHA